MAPRLSWVSCAVTASLLATSTALGGVPLFDTGPPRQMLSSGALTFLGYSSGWLSATQPERWMAQPFTLPAGLWEIDQIDVDYFVPAGFEFFELTFTIWSRDGQNAPVDGDQLVSETVFAPPGLDDPEVDGVEDWLHEIFPTPFFLAGGDYYLTIYGNNGPGFPANAAWLGNPENGINLLDGVGNPFAWRSSAFPVPGFAVYNPATLTQDPALLALDPANALDIFNTSFTIYTVPTPAVLALLGLGGLVAHRRRRAA